MFAAAALFFNVNFYGSVRHGKGAAAVAACRGSDGGRRVRERPACGARLPVSDEGDDLMGL